MSTLSLVFGRNLSPNAITFFPHQVLASLTNLEYLLVRRFNYLKLFVWQETLLNTVQSLSAELHKWVLVLKLRISWRWKSASEASRRQEWDEEKWACKKAIEFLNSMQILEFSALVHDAAFWLAWNDTRWQTLLLWQITSKVVLLFVAFLGFLDCELLARRKIGRLLAVFRFFSRFNFLMWLGWLCLVSDFAVLCNFLGFPFKTEIQISRQKAARNVN